VIKADNEKGSAAEPLLTHHAVTRQQGQEIPGRYCGERRMWVVDLPSGTRPLIDSQGAVTELQTKTEVHVESDDQTDIADLHLVTKTDVQQERDDETQWAGCMLALETKTHVSQEKDKEDFDALASGLLELTTKTAVSAEQDDTIMPYEASPVPLAARRHH
jgi:hypothetical protein